MKINTIELSIFVVMVTVSSPSEDGVGFTKIAQLMRKCSRGPGKQNDKL